MRSLFPESFNQREMEILRLIKIGLSNFAIAQKLSLSLETVKWYNRQIFGKLAVGNRVQAIEKAIEIGLIDTWPISASNGDLPWQTAHLKHNLPASLTTFIGRTKEIEALKEIILTGKNRLVTVTGTGGVGKTRLALQVGWELIECFLDGVFFVSLAATHETGLVVHAIADTFNLHENARQSLADCLQEYLGQKNLLLILDNFEQLLDAGPQVCSLLAHAPNLKMMVTSREILHLAGEQVFILKPLPLPVEQLSWQDALETDPVRLFVERAQAVRLDFHLCEENIRTVLEICRKLDGLPLGIELAAARVRIFNPATILAQLDNRFQVLVGGGRNMPQRQQTLLASIDWSYQLTTPSERTLFHRLAVFAGGCTLEAVEAVCAGSGLEVMKGIESLLDKQLILCSDLGGEPRFGMYETIREFAHECLEKSGERFEVEGRYAEYYAGFLERFFYELNRLEAEIENFRVVMRWSIESNQARPGLRIVSHAWFWAQRNSEWRFWLDNLLNSPGAQTVPRYRMGGIFHAFLQSFFQGDELRCRDILDQYREMEKELADKNNQFGSFYLTGYYHIIHQDYEGAIDDFEMALIVSKRSGFVGGVGYSQWGLGHAFLLTRDYDRAEKALQTAIEIFSKMGFKFQRLESLISLGYSALEKREYRSASELLRRSFEEAIRIGFKAGFVDCLNGLAAISQQNGNYQRAARLYSAVQVMTKTIGSLSKEPPLRIAIQKYLEALRQQMDPVDLDRAWQEGQLMSMEEALEYALDCDAEKQLGK